MERARRFYERVFGWRFEAWGPPDFYLIHTGSRRGSGHPRLGQQARRARHRERAGVGYECTISVDDLAAIKAAVVANGGKIVLDEYEIVGVGRMIRFEDTEGNVACAMRYDRPPGKA